jgi:dienelactone hydrolase
MGGVTTDSERQWWRTLLGLPDPERWRLGAEVGPAEPYEVPREVAEEASRPVPSVPVEAVTVGAPTQPPPTRGLVRRDLKVRVDPDSPEDVECVVLAPAGEKRPVVIVPFYGTGVVVGEPGSAKPGVDPAKRANAVHLANRGLTAVAVPWWFETHRAEGSTLAEKYAAPAAEHQRRHEMTALGRSVADLIAVVDSLSAIPEADAGHVGAYGHSLGGKLAMFLAAMDPRVHAAVASEPGLGFAHSNWEHPWYFGNRVPPGHDLDEVAALIAPRPFLLIRGGDSDGPHNDDMVASARRRAGSNTLTTFDHDEGHTPSWPALDAAYRFLHDGLH